MEGFCDAAVGVGGVVEEGYGWEALSIGVAGFCEELFCFFDIFLKFCGRVVAFVGEGDEGVCGCFLAFSDVFDDGFAVDAEA